MKDDTKRFFGIEIRIIKIAFKINHKSVEFLLGLETLIFLKSNLDLLFSFLFQIEMYREFPF